MMDDLCEWDPVEDCPALITGSGCRSMATLSVGLKDNWHLCGPCAELPQFRRLRRRIPIGPARHIELGTAEQAGSA
jgi:hypothetical protein